MNPTSHTKTSVVATVIRLPYHQYNVSSRASSYKTKHQHMHILMKLCIAKIRTYKTSGMIEVAIGSLTHYLKCAISQMRLATSAKSQKHQTLEIYIYSFTHTHKNDCYTRVFYYYMCNLFTVYVYASYVNV